MWNSNLSDEWHVTVLVDNFHPANRSFVILSRITGADKAHADSGDSDS